MRSPLRFPGGKSRVRDNIIKYFPNFSEYREPFVGGGGVFFGISSDISKRWINDLHSGLICFYKSLRDEPFEFIKKCREIKPMLSGELEISTKQNGKQYNQRLGEKFKYLLKHKDNDPALSYFFINRTVWAGRVNYNIPSRLYYSNPQGWNIMKTNRLELAARHLQNTKITCGDYACLFNNPGDDVLIYADPPYVSNTNMSKTDQQYEFNFTLKDHHRFVRDVMNCKHKICISYDDCKQVRQWFASSRFKIYNESWVYCGSSNSNKKVGKEVIITNY